MFAPRAKLSLLSLFIIFSVFLTAPVILSIMGARISTAKSAVPAVSQAPVAQHVSQSAKCKLASQDELKDEESSGLLAADTHAEDKLSDDETSCTRFDSSSAPADVLSASTLSHNSFLAHLDHLNVPSDCADSLCESVSELEHLQLTAARSSTFTMKDALKLIRSWLNLDEKITPYLLKNQKEMSAVDKELVSTYRAALTAVCKVVIEFNKQTGLARGELKSLKAALEFLASYDGEDKEKGVAKLEQIDTGKLQLTQRIDRLLVAAVEAFVLLDTKCKQCSDTVAGAEQARLKSSKKNQTV
jgi:hypothetical protein